MEAVRRTVLIALIVIVPSVLPAPAQAGPARVSSDRTDNEVAFTYDAASGEITSHTTTTRGARDDVSFQVVVREADDAGSGLVGKLKLRLDGDRHTVYDGWFAFEITDPDGEVAFRRLRPATIHLRPRPGQRRAALPFRFDLPSGDYEARGSFEDRDE